MVLLDRQIIFFIQERAIVSFAGLERDLVVRVGKPDAHVVNAAPFADKSASSIQVFLARVFLRKKLEQRIGDLCSLFSLFPQLFIGQGVDCIGDVVGEGGEKPNLLLREGPGMVPVHGESADDLSEPERSGKAADVRKPWHSALSRQGRIMGSCSMSSQIRYFPSKTALPVGPRPSGTSAATTEDFIRYPPSSP